MAKREEIQHVFICICRDSEWSMEATDAAKLTASVLGVHPLNVLDALGKDNMDEIADGTHPVCKSAFQ